MMKDLSHRGMLANLKIKQWSGRKQDRNVTKQIEKTHNAKKAGNFNKILISEDRLDEIKKIAGAARNYFYEATLPWGDNGDRLLPATNIFNFLAEIRKYREEFERATSEFIKEFPALKMKAKERLNGMYDEKDYPPVSVLATRFLLKAETMPIADVNDFRVAIDPTEVEKLKEEIENSINERIHHATQSIWERIQKVVQHMHEKLSDQEGHFKNSLVTNIEELIVLLPRLNFSNDPNITKVIQGLNTLIVDPDILRSNTSVRIRTADEAKAILDKVSDFFG